MASFPDVSKSCGRPPPTARVSRPPAWLKLFSPTGSIKLQSPALKSGSLKSSETQTGSAGKGDTVTVNASEVFLPPASSVARAVIECCPTAPSDQDDSQGAELTVATTKSSTKNSTCITSPSGSDASAVRVNNSPSTTVAPSLGLVTTMVGKTFGMAIVCKESISVWPRLPEPSLLTTW